MVLPPVIPVCMWLMTMIPLQVEGEGPLAHSQNQHLHRQLLQRQRAALLRSQPEATEAAAVAKEAALRQPTKLEEQPEWIQQGQLYPHQLAVSTTLPVVSPACSALCSALPALSAQSCCATLARLCLRCAVLCWLCWVGLCCNSLV